MIRTANAADLEYLTGSIIALSDYIREQGKDFYTNKLPTGIDDKLVEWASGYLENREKIACLFDDGEIRGCLMGSLGQSNFPLYSANTVGHIDAVWVERGHQGQGIGDLLRSKAEQWFSGQNVEVIELSYMSVNGPAGRYWTRSGYKDFRVFSYKQIS